MSKCVIYSRVAVQIIRTSISSLFPRNIRKITELTVDKVFAEKVSVSKDKTRPEFEAMKKYVLVNNIKRILMWELSRLARDTIKSLTSIKEFETNGIGIYFLKENLDT